MTPDDKHAWLISHGKMTTLLEGGGNRPAMVLWVSVMKGYTTLGEADNKDGAIDKVFTEVKEELYLKVEKANEATG